MAKKGTLRIQIVGDDKDLNRTMSRAGKTLGKFAAAAGAAVIAMGVVSVKSFADFDQAMTRSVAIMGDVSDTMRKDMSDAAREVAKTTAFSAAQAAESYFFLASAGLDAAESIAALPKVAAFAQAGNFEMARATDLLTDAQSALGMVVDDSAQSLANMARVGDVLVKANTLANASVEQFSEALTNKAGAALAQLNKDVEEGVAVLAVYAEQGVKGAEAGNRLNAVLEGLTRTAREQESAYAAMGVSVFDAEGEMRNMADIVGDLEGALHGMSTEQQLAELASLGLTRQARDGVIQLLGNADAIREYEAALQDAAGTTDDVASKQMETFWMQLGLLKDQLMDVALTVGERLMPALMNLVDRFQQNLPAIEAFVERGLAKIAEITTNYVVPAFQTLGTWIGAVIDWWKGLSPGVQTAIKTFGAALAITVAVIAVLVKVIAVVKVVAAVFAVLLSPIGLVVAAIAAVIAIGILLWRNWDTITAKARDLQLKVFGFFVRLRDGIVDAGERIRDRFTAAMEGMKNGVRAVVNPILGFINAIIGGYERMINAIGSAINRIPTFTVPDWVPVFGGNSFGLPKIPTVSLPRIPMLASGGIVDQATLAVVGESGPERVSPLGGGRDPMMSVMSQLLALAEREQRQLTAALRQHGPVDEPSTARHSQTVEQHFHFGRDSINIEGVGDARKAAEEFRRELLKLGKRNNGTGIRE